MLKQDFNSVFLWENTRENGFPSKNPWISSIHLTRRQRFLEVTVYQNQVEKALKVLKRQMTKEGLLKELKRRRFYEKPSVKKKRKQKEAKKKRKAAMRRMRSYNRI
tara:strand:- start:30 stop:347 length:318 start_codon:yes stop_codon:yes gene_type:complete